MKHLSQVPSAPSSIRPEIPRDLDLVVLRALAKEPAERYRSAKEMDRDLELVGRGEPVGTETEAAATMVLRGETTAATTVRPVPAGFGGDERYRSYEGEVRTGRAWWPWLVALGRGGRARRDRLVRLRRRPRPDRRERADCGRQLHRHPRGERRRPDRRRRVRGQGRPAAQQRRAAEVRLPAGARAGYTAAEGQHRHGARLDRQAEGDRPVRRRQVARHGGRGAHAARPRCDGGRGELRASVRRGDGAEPPRGHGAGLRLVRADQRLERPQADSRAERRRLELRARRRTAPVGRVHRRSGRRGEQRAVGDGRHAEPAGELDGDARLVGDALGLARAVHRDGARRLLPDGRRRARDACAPRDSGFASRVRRPTTSRWTASSSRRIRPPPPRRTPTR